MGGRERATVTALIGDALAGAAGVSILDDADVATLMGAAARAATGRAEPGAWFEAGTAEGPLHLWVAGAAGSVRHAADAALALQRCDDLLGALDDWAGAELDWRWTAAPAAGSPGVGHAYVGWRDSPCRLLCPWPWLRARPAPSPALSAGLHWPAVEAVLSLALIALDDDELSQLEPGGAVLLAASMRPQWRGRLRAADEPVTAGVCVDLADPGAPRVLAGADAAAPAGAPDGGSPAGTHAPGGPDLAAGPAGACFEVRLASDRALPADRLAGWRAGALPDFGSRTELWRCAGARGPAACLASGTLIPWGDGQAMLVDRLGAGGLPEDWTLAEMPKV